jgi:hypothetical protein
VGYLEEDGFPVTGDRDVRLNLYASDGAGVACDVQYFDGVPMNEGRFQVEVIDVPDACLIGGELFAGLAVGPVGGTLIDLSTGVGSGRVQVAAVPFAAASPKVATFLTEGDADVGTNLRVRGDAQVDGVARIPFAADVEPGSGGSLIVGQTTGVNLAMDNNEVMARNNGATSSLYLNNNGGTVLTGADLDVGDDLFVTQGAHFDCPSCGSTTTFDGASNWGDLTIQGRVLSTSDNLHLSPPGGRDVWISDDYRAAGGTTAGSAGLYVQGDISVGGDIDVTCTERATTCSDDGGGNLVYMDRHDMYCPAGDYMSGWRLHRCNSSTIRIYYTCCSF